MQQEAEADSDGGSVNDCVDLQRCIKKEEPVEEGYICKPKEHYKTTLLFTHSLILFIVTRLT